ncbi:hypothetical protein NQ318_006007 [Aromia moschata]|uniref:Receptor ligand binding region domain-containing protein n=1 Tax=Aromia moschata TaxID=1265417 RepID=A0AAV8Y0Q5_9CUCU|nr:hypothetical protein NQ318_006007 [Aromia moschata]
MSYTYSVFFYVNHVPTVVGIFENNDPLEKAFHYASNTVNSNQQEDDFTLVPLVNNQLIENAPFPALNNVCSFLNVGVVGVFGPSSRLNAIAIQSICDAKEVPHITTKYNHFAPRDGTEINFHPHPPTLSMAYFDVVMAWEWKSFTVLYEDNESLLRVNTLIQLAKERGVLVSVQQLDKYQTGNYRTTLKQIKTTGEKFFVIDCQIQNLMEVLLQFQQVGLMSDQYNYFITNLDTHTQELTPFQYAGANITGIRLVNPEREFVQKVSRELYADDDSVFPELVAWYLSSETALLIDAVHMFSTALNDRKKQSSVPIVNNNNILQCNGSDSWEHGYSVINLLRTMLIENNS